LKALSGKGSILIQQALISLYYTDIVGNSYPVNFRIYDKSEGKTNNDYFLEMLEEVKSWGLRPAWMTGDSWYKA
jgi:hypothetical protein